MEEVYRRLEQLETKTDDCAKSVEKCALSMQECANNVKLIQLDISHQLTSNGDRMNQLQEAVTTQDLILNGNPRQDTKDRGLIGDVEQLKGTEARKSKLYWGLVSAVLMAIVTSFWNSITGSGKDDHGRSEVRETTVQKTGPGRSYSHSERRSDRRE